MAETCPVGWQELDKCKNQNAEIKNQNLSCRMTMVKSNPKLRHQMLK